MQTYPSMEYRFTPERITVTTEDVLCFVWSGEKILQTCYGQIVVSITDYRFKFYFAPLPHLSSPFVLSSHSKLCELVKMQTQRKFSLIVSAHRY